MPQVWEEIIGILGSSFPGWSELSVVGEGYNGRGSVRVTATIPPENVQHKMSNLHLRAGMSLQSVNV